MTATASTTPTSTGPRLGRAIALAGAISVVVNLAIYVIARIADVDLLVPEGPGSDTLSRLGVGPVVVASVLPLVLAALVALGLRRWTTQPTRIFRLLVALGFVLSYVNVVAGDLSGETALTVGLMHPIVAATAWFFVTPLTDTEEA